MNRRSAAEEIRQLRLREITVLEQRLDHLAAQYVRARERIEDCRAEIGALPRLAWSAPIVTKIGH